MGHVIASYLRQVWDKNDWLYEGQHGFRPGYSGKCRIITVCQLRTFWVTQTGLMLLDDFLKAFDLLLHGRLLMKIANS